MFQIESVGLEEFFSRFDNLLEDKIKSAVAAALNSQPQQSASSNGGWLTREDVAKMFSTSLDTIDNWSKAKILNPHKMGNRTYFKPNEVASAPKPKHSKR
ncbi:MAG: helix-turn-helix domain-containing protein [Dysgonamonadaceae bacterium]|nr:helix-turn-helix domain-containing protein [Dysgonamonadaceae bacterium]